MYEKPINNMEYSIIITDHAFDRIKERSNLNKKAAVRLAEKAFENGISHGEATGGLHKYISGLTFKSKKGTHIKIYGDKVYIFNKSNKSNVKEFTEDNKLIVHLITVLPLPTNLVKISNSIMTKKKSRIAASS